MAMMTARSHSVNENIGSVKVIELPVAATTRVGRLRLFGSGGANARLAGFWAILVGDESSASNSVFVFPVRFTVGSAGLCVMVLCQSARTSFALLPSESSNSSDAASIAGAHYSIALGLCARSSLSPPDLLLRCPEAV